MKKLKLVTKFEFFTLALVVLLVASCAHATDNVFDRQELDQFINTMVEKHDYDQPALEQLFSQVKYSRTVIEAITRPAERLPWYRYKDIFLTEDRIDGGVDYWHRYADVLAAAEDRFGVPAEIIVAIIGVETRYGEHKGRYRVLDSLSTLAFDYPKRSDFFRRELEHFLLLTREQKIDPLVIKGSYAGAMGIPQFIPSSYRSYAVDFDGNGRINLWDDHIDAIGSVASYFNDHGWQSGETVIVPVAEIRNAEANISDGLKPERTYAELKRSGVIAKSHIDEDVRVALLKFDTSEGNDYWLGLDNFYVITRYNHSQLYALAVYLLAQEIKSRYQESV